jgi:uncharacterized protein (DUF2235 family)
MSRQLIICCDGTNNNLTGGARDTNVTKLCDLLAPDANGQLLYYDPGVGNPGELPGASLTDNLSRIYERLHGLALAKAFTKTSPRPISSSCGTTSRATRFSCSGSRAALSPRAA